MLMEDGPRTAEGSTSCGIGAAVRIISLVILVKPGSVMEKAGCMVSDELIQEGDLKGGGLMGNIPS